MVIPVAKDPKYYETRFSWIYYHKSQYCFVLLLFIAFSVICRKQFKNKWFFPVSNLVFLFGIVISHTYTALFAAVLIYAGLALDALRSKLRTLNKKYFLLLIPPVILLAFVIWRMSRERNIWTLGSRTYISLGMDYSLLGREFTLTFFYFYMIFFLPNTKEQISD